MKVYDIILFGKSERIGQIILSEAEFLRITGMRNVLSPSRNLGFREIMSYGPIFVRGEDRNLTTETLLYLSAYQPGKEK